MEEKLRISGIDIIGNIPWGSHFCQFYQTKEDLIGTLIPYIKAGLENNEFCLWIESGYQKIGEDADILRRNIPDFDTYLQKEQIEIISDINWYIKSGVLDPERVLSGLIEKLDQALTSGYAGLRVIENTSWLGKESWNKFIDYEERLNSFININQMIVLCPYSLNKCNTADIIEIVANHQFYLVRKDGKWKRIESSGNRDIIKLKQAEERLEKLLRESQASKSRLEAVLKCLPVGVIIADAPSGKLVIGNEWVKKIFRGSLPLSASIEEYSAYTGFHPEGRQYTEEEWPLARAVQKGEEVIGEEIEFQLADGTRRIISVSATPILDEEGRITNAVVVDEDITERKMAERALRASEERYRYLYESSLDGILLTKPDGTILSANPQACYLFGMTEDEIIRAGREGLVVKDEKFISALRERELTGQAKAELVFRRKDGSTFISETSSSLFKDADGITKTSMIIRDITERKQEEHRIRRYNSVLEGINRIFSSVVNTGTKEELGTACLSVALEITSSHIGFVGLVDDSGLFHNIAISDIGQEKCLMHEKIGNCHSPGNFLLHGLCGHIINNGKSFFTNDPLSHLRGIGLPQGHPPLASFLGIPLTSEGRIVGVIGVANRENGYSFDQQEDLEAIAPAVMQVLQRKKEENERERAEEALRESQTKLEAALASMKDAILIADAQGRFIDFNDAFVTFHRFKNKEECSRTFAEYPDILDVFMADGAPSPVDMWAVPRALRGETATDAEYILRRKDTGETWVGSYSFAPIRDKEGTIVGSVVIGRDITERKKMEEDLRKNEERYRMLFTNMTDGFFLAEVVYNKDGEPCDYYFIELNPAYESNTGLKREQVLGKSLHEVLPNPNSMLLKSYGEVALSGQSTHCEIFSQALNKYLEFYVFSPEKGKIATIFRDITERKKAENSLSEAYEELQMQSEELQVQAEELQEAYEALCKSEEKYRNIIETANEGIWIVDSEAQTAYVNKKMSEMLGYAREEMIGTYLQDFTDEEDIAKFELNMEKRRQGVDESHEFKFIRKDGSPLWTIVNAKSLFDKYGRFTGSMKMLTDITERKRAETRLKETLDNLESLVKERTAELQNAYSSLKESEKSLAEAQQMAHLGNWNWNIVTDKIHWSDETYRIFGHKPHEFDPNYDIFVRYIHPDDHDYVDNAVKKALKGEPYSIDFRIVLADGAERIVREQGEAVFDEENNPIRMKGTVQDITEHKQAEKALEKMQETHIKEIHHRIKNNLQVISSLLSLQAEKFSNEKVLEAFKESQNRVASMALIHEELYRGKETDNLDFAAYLRKLTVDLLRSYNLRNNGISLKLNFEQIYLDMDAAIPLGIVVNELISNSLKHAFPNGKEGEIKITLQKAKKSATAKENSEIERGCKQDNFHYLLTLADNGKGIKEKIDFMTADSLGLQLVKILVEQIDGCIELRRDKGTEFLIWFSNTKK